MTPDLLKKLKPGDVIEFKHIWSIMHCPFPENRGRFDILEAGTVAVIVAVLHSFSRLNMNLFIVTSHANVGWVGIQHGYATSSGSIELLVGS